MEEVKTCRRQYEVRWPAMEEVKTCRPMANQLRLVTAVANSL
jgi:hypothetical protein